MSTLLDLDLDLDTTPERSGTSPAGQRRRSWQAKSLVAGGVLFGVGNALHPLEHTDAAYKAATWEAAHLLILASIPLLILGLPVVHRMLRGRVSDRWALLPVVSVMVGLVGLAPGTVIETFIAPTIGNAAMTELESGGMGIVDAVFGIAFLGGTLALGWALRRSGVRPRWAGPALMGIAGVLLVCMGLTGPIGGIVIISATIAYGSALAILGLRA
ncbi:MAG TPA: hypothetical protein VH479_12795 [Acidimicrobiales bacterium]|jgi:hypothetical protein